MLFENKIVTPSTQRIREHANRVAGGFPSDKNYDPETLEIEHDAADEIERLRTALSAIEVFGHGKGCGCGYTCANMANDALKI